MAKRTAIGLNEIRKLINTEEKYIDTYNSISATRTGVVVYMNPMAQGDNITDRTGDSIKVQSVYAEATTYFNPAATNPQTVRFMVIRDLNNLGVLPSGSDVLANAGSAYAVTAPVNFINGKELNKRFSILHDEFVTLDQYNQTGTFSFKSNSDKHTYFRGTSAATTDAGNGAYFYLIFTDVASTTPTAYVSTRIVFTDD